MRTLCYNLVVCKLAYNIYTKNIWLVLEQIKEIRRAGHSVSTTFQIRQDVGTVTFNYDRQYGAHPSKDTAVDTVPSLLKGWAVAVTVGLPWEQRSRWGADWSVDDMNCRCGVSEVQFTGWRWVTCLEAVCCELILEIGRIGKEPWGCRPHSRTLPNKQRQSVGNSNNDEGCVRRLAKMWHTRPIRFARPPTWMNMLSMYPRSGPCSLDGGMGENLSHFPGYLWFFI
jgi:hypothetical protein